MSDGYLELADWRRRVAALFATWRAEAIADPERATAAFREARDALFLHHPQSPLPPGRRLAGIGAKWWPYDPAYRMTVTFEPADGLAGPHASHFAATAAGAAAPLAAPALLDVPSSGDAPVRVRQIGRLWLVGPLEGHALSVLWIEGYGNGIFLPFRDATSGHETYGAGRYLLDTVKGADHGGDPASAALVLDFNLAFHPSCAYDPKWVCPLAPPANAIPVPIRVGERLAG
jgi:uncharacterized protein